MPRVVVLHREYGCDTGCCGHVIEVDGQQTGQFHFHHPYDAISAKTDEEREAAYKAYAEELVREELGEEHVKDLAWDECQVYYD